MAAMNAGAWSETCLIDITPKGSTAVQFAALTETVDIDQGDKDIEQVVNLKGGRIVKKTPQDLTTITFEGYAVGVNAVTGASDLGPSQFFNASNTTFDTTETTGIISTPTIGRLLYRVCIMWTEDTTPTTASGASTALFAARRYAVVNAYLTSYKESFTDGILKYTMTFKVPAFNKQGTAQIREDSTLTTTALSALTTYNTTNFPEDGTTFTWT